MPTLSSTVWILVAMLSIAGVAWWRRRSAWRREARARGADLELLSLLAHPRHFCVTPEEYRDLLKRERHVLFGRARNAEPPPLEQVRTR